MYRELVRLIKSEDGNVGLDLLKETIRAAGSIQAEESSKSAITCASQLPHALESESECTEVEGSGSACRSQIKTDDVDRDTEGLEFKVLQLRQQVFSLFA